MFRCLSKKKIPLILLNARLTKKTFNRWKKISSFTRSVLKNVTLAFPQNVETKFFLRNFNVKKVNLIGNLKFIENKDENLNKIENS